jgi:hypothetical protein
MILRLLIAIAFVCGAVPTWAAERATVVLQDGSRHSGELVFHGSGQRNIIDDFFNLGSGGKEQTFPVDRIAFIDFGGGDPTAADLRLLNDGGTHLLVLRSGDRQRGRLVNVVRGDTLQWRNEAGDSQEYGVRDVARVVMNAETTRRVMPQLTDAAPSRDGETGSRSSVRVAANERWSTTGVRVRKGDRVTFSASGQVQVSPDAAHTSGPDGNPAVPKGRVPVPEMGVGGLIGRVGLSDPFPIGSNREPIAMPENGLLMLGVNDTEFGDNAGAFTVAVQADEPAAGTSRRRGR